MKKIISVVIAAALSISFIPASAYDIKTVNNSVSGYVSDIGGDILIASNTKTPRIYVDAENDYTGVVRAAGDLQKDIKAVTGVEANIAVDAESADIIIGTVGKSDAVDALIEEDKLDVSEIENQWEAFTLQNVGGKLVIAGADKRGTIYGIYDLSEKMGVSPWEWWADVVPQRLNAVYVTLPENGYTEGEPSVKYRGIFINQEYNLNRWSLSINPSGGYMNTDTYEKIFELLLRLKANYMWPAMHEYSPAFNKNPENAKKADEYGIVMGTSHCEMLLRNNMGELLDFQERWIAENPDKNLYMFRDGSLGKDVAYDYTDVDKDGNHVYNKDFVEDYWRERVRENKDYESNFTIGMRGVHDGTWSPVSAKTDAEKIALLEEIIAKQREILSEEIGKPAEEIPQTFIPYKEILPLYNKGVNVPDDVTIMWTNDNYGHIRQSSNAAERERSGGGGMYYHVSYYGRPSSVLWNGGTQLGLIKEEMTKAYDGGADTVWILNVGPMKSFENQMEYFLDLGRNISKVRNIKVKDYVKDNAKRYFNFTDEQAEEYADIQCNFLEAANSRRPEFQVQGLYSLTAGGDEGQKQIDRYAALVKRSETLYNALSADKQPAFYELQLYALKSGYNVINNIVNADKSVLYKNQNRGGGVNKYAERSAAGRDAVDTNTAVYTGMLGGKWDKAINPFQTRLHMSIDIKIAGGAAKTVEDLPYTEMGIAVENQRDITEKPVLVFSGYTKDVRFIDIFNRGTGSFEWTAKSDEDWIVFNKASGVVHDDDRIYAGVDWDRVPAGINSGKITVERYIGGNIVQTEEIDVSVDNNVKILPEKTYAEANGYISIEAEHFTNSISYGNYEWVEQDDFGRSGTSMKFMPDTEDSIEAGSAYLEYDVNFENTGTFSVDVYRMPTLNERGSVNFALGVDDATPTLLKGNNAYYNNSTGTDKWGNSILNNVETLTASVNIAEKGIHKIKLYGVDPGAVVDKIVITTGTKYSLFYGEPESYNTTYNSLPAQMPEAKAASTEISGNVTELFSPKLYTTGINLDDGAFGVAAGGEPRLITPKKGGTAVIAVYTSNGTLSGIQISDVYENGAYVFKNAVNLKDDETVRGMVWSSLSEMKPISKIYREVKEGGVSATGVNIIKLSDVSNTALTVAAYNADGVMLDKYTISHNFENAEINEKVTVPIDFNIPEETAELQAIVYDGIESLNALSPSCTVNMNKISLAAAYDSGVIQIKSSLDKNIGREAICRISDASSDETVYIRQETIKDGTFKTVKTGGLNGVYDVNIGVADKGIVVNEKAYTEQNIATDNAETRRELYNWDFSTDMTESAGNNVPVLGGNSAYDETNHAVKMTSTDKSGGSLSAVFDKPVTTAQGQTITVESKIAYGRQDGKYMDYVVSDSQGNELVKSHISIYSSKGAIFIGGEQVFDGVPDGVKNSKKNNDGIQNGYSTYNTVLNPDTKTITLTISNADGESVFTGKFPETSSFDLGALKFSATTTYKGRSCYVDDISVSKITAPSYTMVFNVKDNAGNKIEGAQIKLTDGKFGTEINAESDGTYHLCDGIYEYTVTADGYIPVKGELELSQATESKTISVEMEKH
jgi:hypothetical protein